MVTDPISDFLTRVRNAQSAGHKVVDIPASKIKKEITKILFDQGYILNYKFEDSAVQGNIKIALKYDKQTNKPAIKSIFQPTLSATDGPENRHYLQLNLQSAGSDLQSLPANRHDLHLQLKRRPETHLSMPNPDVVFWAGFLDSGKPRQTLSGM